MFVAASTSSATSHLVKPASAGPADLSSPLGGDDFRAVVDLVAKTWYKSDTLSGDAYAAAWLGAADETASYLAPSTWSCKATVDGELVGAIVVCDGTPDPLVEQHWTHVSHEARAEQERHARISAAHRAATTGREAFGAIRKRPQRRTAPQPVVANPSAPLLDELRATREMRDEAGLASSPQVTLLIVDERTRGMGLGRALMDRAREHFAREGARRFWLMTDTTCNWKFYEHLGMSRMAERDGHGPNTPEQYFAYAMVL